ncbi:MAG: 2-hydroxyacyl-CoA dehydratase [Veillonellaceae bacterium]|nr:2-hydroxyacyl-CoA dehydratase [Veillonellaceae bacterium]
MARIGMTTTVPVEIILAGGHVPVDLNNVFITGAEPVRRVEAAEDDGYPRNICGWIKGLYSTVVRTDCVDAVIAVTQGDCSNTHALMETWQLAGVRVIPFAYPFDRDADLLRLQMQKLAEALGAEWVKVLQQKQDVDRIRRKVSEIDRLTWQENKVSGLDNHLFQVSCSDFNSDLVRFEADVDAFLRKTDATPARKSELRLGYIGVPPIFTDLYSYVESQGARVVFNEVQRQFAMPYGEEDIVEQYRHYTYPYGIFGRLDDIQAEVERRQLDGVIHYVQSFCYRQIEDMIVRRQLKVPVLTIEGDKPGCMDARTRLRVDGFIEMLK